MPYILGDSRHRINQSLKQLDIDIYNEGDFAYTVYRLMLMFSGNKTNFTTISSVVGVVECVIDEYKRRILHPYEDKKRQDNGDIL